MNDVLAQFGVAADAVAPAFKTVRQKVASRTLHIDGDFIAYQIAADTRDELDGIRPRRDLQYKLGQIDDIGTELMEKAGAGRYVFHVTPGGSTKGGRPDQVVQKEYQANRLGRDKPEHLDAIRAAIGGGIELRYGSGLPHLDQEADDGLTQAALLGPDHIILSRDKDLRMASGLHFDADTEEIIEVDGFGSIYIDDSKSSKKLVGYGTKFFWAQCLMGDTADNIAGLPLMSGKDSQRGNKDYAGDCKIMDGTWEVPEVMRNKVKAKWSKTKAVGPVAAFKLLDGCHSDKECYQRVKECFENVAAINGYQFTHWKTGAAVTPTQALFGDMQALWMRRNKDPMDVLAWLKSQIA